MPKVTITGTTEQVLDAMGFGTKPKPIIGRHVAKRGTNERAKKNKQRGDAQKLLIAAFKAIRHNPDMVHARDRMLAAMRKTEMPAACLLDEADRIYSEFQLN